MKPVVPPGDEPPVTSEAVLPSCDQPQATTENRDVSLPVPVPRVSSDGRHLVAVVGIDKYQHWGELKNAANDARGVLQIFTQLGFEQACAPLYDQAATFDAIRKLATTTLKKTLQENDSLVVFFAGHGHTVTETLQGTAVRVGYVIPADGDRAEGHAGSWLQLETWLKDIARLPPRHILVIIDSCHSGMALALDHFRGHSSTSLERLRARRSRRVITSAQDDQVALDNGPLPNHSLFTGILIRALRGAIATDGRSHVTGSELAVFVQRHVDAQRKSLQTPDFGSLPLDARGEMLIPILGTGGLIPLPKLPSRFRASQLPTLWLSLAVVSLALALVAVWRPWRSMTSDGGTPARVPDGTGGDVNRFAAAAGRAGDPLPGEVRRSFPGPVCEALTTTGALVDCKFFEQVDCEKAISPRSGSTCLKPPHQTSWTTVMGPQCLR